MSHGGARLSRRRQRDVGLDRADGVPPSVAHDRAAVPGELRAGAPPDDSQPIEKRERHGVAGARGAVLDLEREANRRGGAGGRPDPDGVDAFGPFLADPAPPAGAQKVRREAAAARDHVRARRHRLDDPPPGRGRRGALARKLPCEQARIPERDRGEREPIDRQTAAVDGRFDLVRGNSAEPLEDFADLLLDRVVRLPIAARRKPEEPAGEKQSRVLARAVVVQWAGRDAPAREAAGRSLVHRPRRAATEVSLSELRRPVLGCRFWPERCCAFR